MEDVNDRSKSNAIAAWIIESGFLGFGGQENERDVSDYLPFKIVDPNDPTEKLKRDLGDRTIEIFKQLVRDGELPGHIVRDFYSIDAFYQLVREEEKSDR